MAGTTPPPPHAPPSLSDPSGAPTRPSVRAWLGWPGWAVLVLATAGLAALAHLGDQELAAPNLAQVAASLLLLGSVVRWTRLQGLTRPVAALAIVPTALWYAGDVVGLVTLALGWQLGSVPLVELTYLIAQTGFVVAALVATRLDGARRPTRRVVDGVLVGCAVAIFVWTLGDGVSSSTSRVGYGLATLGVDGVLVACALLATPGRTVGGRRPVLPLCAATIVLLLTDAAFVYRDHPQTTASVWLLDLGWTTATMLAVLGVHLLAAGPAETAPAPPTTVASHDDAHRSSWLLPGTLLLVLGVTLVRPPHAWGDVSTALMAVLFTLLAAREVVSRREQRHLHDDATATSEALRRRVERDDLTGLSNRAALVDRLAALAADQDAGAPVHVAFLDLDGFKQVNDTFGHRIGDRLLAVAADRLRDGLPDAELLARVGGDEFVVVLRGPPTVAVVERTIRDLFGLPARLDGATVRLVPSVGAALLGTGPDAGRDALAAADARAYLAKGVGRAGAARPAAADPMAMGRLREILDDLDRGNLRAHYQPVVDLRTGRIAGAAALARWVDADGRTHPASTFVTPLVASGNGARLFRALVEQAFRDFSHGRTELEGWFVSLVVTPEDLLHPDTLPLLAGELDRTVFAAERLHLEVQAPAEHLPRLVAPVRALHDLGIQVDLANVNRYGGIGMILALGPDAVTFELTDTPVLGPETSTGSLTHQHRELLLGLLRLGHEADVRLHAKRIETVAELRFLTTSGCDLGQGQVFAPALPLDELVALPLQMPPARRTDDA